MMTTSDGFLSRWARRKAAAQVTPIEAVPVAETAPVVELPDVETMGSGSDYTAFLQKGVAAEVQRRALQRAWESDAGIAAFRGMADYDWDFNAPSYGRLWASDNVAELLRAVLAPPPEAEPLPEPPVVAVAELAAVVANDPADGVVAVDMTASEQPGPTQRRHGSALPC